MSLAGSPSPDYNRMIVLSVFFHLLFFTLVAFLPTPRIAPRKIMPVMSVSLVELPGMKGDSASKGVPREEKAQRQEPVKPPPPPPTPPEKKITQTEAKKIIKELEQLAKTTKTEPPKPQPKSEPVKETPKAKPPPEEAKKVFNEEAKPVKVEKKPEPQEKKEEKKKEEHKEDIVKELQQLAEATPRAEAKRTEPESAKPPENANINSLESLTDKLKLLEKTAKQMDVDVKTANNDKAFASKLRGGESIDKKSSEKEGKAGVPGIGSSPVSSSPDILNWYVGLVRDKVMANWKSPLGAMNNEVLVSFFVYPEGNIGKPHLQKGTSDEQLDVLAIRAILDAAPFPKFPKELKEPNLYVTIRFKYVSQD